MTITTEQFSAMSQGDKAALLKSDVAAWNIAHQAFLVSNDYAGANLRGADLYGANLRGANLYGANLRGANLRGADLYGADLYGANLRGADLRGANLYGANLRGANLYGANLRGANLRGANLYGANLYGANLRGADLYGANLRGANLRGANLRGADGESPMTLLEWCELFDLAACGAKGMRVAFKRLPADRVTGAKHGHPVTWVAGRWVECADWSDERECGNGLHLSATPQDTRTYSSEDLVVPVAFYPEDGVQLGDKIKVRKCKVLG